MKTFKEFLNKNLVIKENVIFTGYSKDGRIFVNVNGERKTIVLDAILHNKVRRMEEKNAEKAYDYLLGLIDSGDAFIL